MFGGIVDAADSWLSLEDFAEEIREKTGVPGLSIGVLFEGEILNAGFGIGNMERGTPVWGESLFQVGSISKTFTATLVMGAVADGLLELDAPVRAYLPDFRVADEEVSAAVTLRHLLTHSGGWDGDVFLETGDGREAIREFIPRLADREQLFPPGAYFSYNNSGFAVLGAILEVVCGDSYEALVRKGIFEPFGMERAFLNAAEVINEDFVVGHKTVEGNLEVARPWRIPRGTLPVGGIVTNTGDLLRYAAGLMGGEGGVLPAARVAEMWTPELPIHGPEATSIGLSWMRRDFADTYLVQHSGGTNGQVTLLTLLPAHRFAVAVLSNGDLGRRPTQKTAAFALKEFLGLDLPSPAEIRSTPGELAAYAGTAERPGFTLNLQMLGDYLVGLLASTIGFPTENDPPSPPEPPFRVGRCEEDRLLILEGRSEGVAIDVIRGADGEIRFMRLGGRMYRFSR